MAAVSVERPVKAIAEFEKVHAPLTEYVEAVLNAVPATDDKLPEASNVATPAPNDENFIAPDTVNRVPALSVIPFNALIVADVDDASRRKSKN